MKRRPMKATSPVRCTLLALMALGFTQAWAGPVAKNVIVMVPDGCDQSVQTLARWYSWYAANQDAAVPSPLADMALALDAMNTGTVRTWMASSVITDSASAGTAFASGYKTTDAFVGVGPRPDDAFEAVPEDLQYRPLATVLEVAKLVGKSTGLVSTSRVTHATPAAFASHVMDRDWENDIMEHLVYNEVDVVFGGGMRHLLPTDQGGRRTDGENLVDVLLDRGYELVQTRDEMFMLNTAPAWGMFASSHMAADLDNATLGLGEPSLAEMTAKAIELLSQDPDGFFLMVEASQVDWAGHANDPIYMVTDLLAFDEAVAVALEFAGGNRNTLVLAFPDHNTGGLTIGNARSDSTYTSRTIEDLVGPLMGMRITTNTLPSQITDPSSPSAIQAAILEWWGIEITLDEAEAIVVRAAEVGLGYAIAEVVSATHTYFGWTTHGHNGGDVPLWAYGPNPPVGNLDNTELAHVVAEAFDFELDEANDYLYVDIRDTNATWVLEETDPANPVLRVRVVPEVWAELPVSKDLLYIAGREFNLKGLVVHSPPATWCAYPDGTVSDTNPVSCDEATGEKLYAKDWETVYLPWQALRIIWEARQRLMP